MTSGEHAEKNNEASKGSNTQTSEGKTMGVESKAKSTPTPAAAAPLPAKERLGMKGVLEEKSFHKDEPIQATLTALAIVGSFGLLLFSSLYGVAYLGDFNSNYDAWAKLTAVALTCGLRTAPATDAGNTNLNQSENITVPPHEKYPWLVRIDLVDPKTQTLSSVSCEGALVHPDYVLTSARCCSRIMACLQDDDECAPWATFGISTGKLIEKYDEQFINSSSQGIYTTPVAKCLQHPLFTRTCYKDRSSYRYGYDLGLVQLSNDQTPQTLKNETLRLANNTGNFAVNYLCSSPAQEGHEEKEPGNRDLVIIRTDQVGKGNTQSQAKLDNQMRPRSGQLGSQSKNKPQPLKFQASAESDSPSVQGESEKTTVTNKGAESQPQGKATKQTPDPRGSMFPPKPPEDKVPMELVNLELSPPEECRKVYPDFDTETLMCILRAKNRQPDPLVNACRVRPHTYSRLFWDMIRSQFSQLQLRIILLYSFEKWFGRC